MDGDVDVDVDVPRCKCELCELEINLVVSALLNNQRHPISLAEEISRRPFSGRGKHLQSHNTTTANSPRYMTLQSISTHNHNSSILLAFCNSSLLSSL